MKSFGQCARPWVSGLQIVLEPICEIPLASWQEQLGWVFKRRLFKGTDIVLYTNEDWIPNLVTVKSIMEILFTKAEPKIHSFWLLIRRHNTFEIPLGEEIFRVGNSRNTFRVTFASCSFKSWGPQTLLLWIFKTQNSEHSVRDAEAEQYTCW